MASLKVEIFRQSISEQEIAVSGWQRNPQGWSADQALHGGSTEIEDMLCGVMRRRALAQFGIARDRGELRLGHDPATQTWWAAILEEVDGA